MDELVSRITNELEINKPYEIILIDDGSMDNSWLKIVGIGRTNPNVKGIKLSKNLVKRMLFLCRSQRMYWRLCCCYGL